MREVRGHCAGTWVQRSEECQDERQFNEPAWRHEPVDLLLAAPFIALLWVPFYNSIEPKLWGIPFFYWYQFLWVFITSGLILWVYHRNAAGRSRN